jgi:hypothetical protein
VGIVLDTVSLRVLGCQVNVQCRDAASPALLVAQYGHLQSSPGLGALHYTVDRQEGSGRFMIIRASQPPLIASDPGEFLFLFEKDMTVEIQKLRRDLYFVHAAVLQFGHKAFMLVGESGSGKSTTTWALLHHGCGYWSDELGPVDLQTLEVYPYPRALCLKGVPPAAYPQPKSTICTPRTLHIPTAALPSEVGRAPASLGAIFFVHYQSGAFTPIVQPMSKATAVARLLANALNPLAHAVDGLDGAITLGTSVASFDLTAADLTATSALVQATLQGLTKPAADRTLLGKP